MAVLASFDLRQNLLSHERWKSWSNSCCFQCSLHQLYKVVIKVSFRMLPTLWDFRKKLNIYIYFDAVDVDCHCFEDNSCCLELAKFPKMRPCIQHINICYNHFSEYVRQGEIKTHVIDTNYWIADKLTNPLQHNLLVKYHKMLIRVQPNN